MSNNITDATALLHLAAERLRRTKPGLSDPPCCVRISQG